ncbi:hypothetical protein HDE76_001260 [Rhodanobacter sp. ANJX3]|uniref:DUF6869 domain-containing protein n=1 Tax=Rhodanobacter sp. ANJX3 TaxID=2723083 RepID=UPI001610CC82|nr:hypothetical protein [Rhodanobacter sp. ANJX3]MBB5358054.1 hypothetical protein [Rhodanobacter sp. ANJX3]
MESLSPSEIAEKWIQAWSGTEPPAVGAGVGASRLDWELPRENQELCLESIINVLARIDGSSLNRLLSVLAAGSLEDLLAVNGYVVVEQVEVLARRSLELRLLLNGVWDRTIKPDVLSKLAKYRNQRW